MAVHPPALARVILEPMPGREAGSIDDGKSRHTGSTARGAPIGVEEAAETICRVARLLAAKPMSLQELVAQLRLEEYKVRSALAALASQGYVKVVEIKPCSGCPFARICPFARLRRPMRVYKLIALPPWCTKGR